MNKFMTMTAISAAAMLAACDSSDNCDTTGAGDMMTESTAENSAEKTGDKSTMPSAPEVVLKTASLQEFEASLAIMRASLTDDERAELTDALAKLSGEMMERAEAAVTPGTELAPDMDLAEAVYKKYGNKLNGKTFDDIVAMTK